MIKVFVLAFLLLTEGSFGAPCSIAPNRLVPVSDLIKCLRGIPYNTSSAEIRNLIPTLKSYYENNPYIDWFRSPPPGYEKYAFDFIAELDEIGAKSGGDGFDYYVALSQLFLKFKDGHALFLPPCLWNYYYALPFDILVVNGDSDDDFLTPYFYVDGVVSGAIDVNIDYSQIVGIDFNGGSNFTSISKAVSDFALKYGSVQYNNHALWNNQIVIGFFGLNAAFFPPPVNDNVTLQVILENKTAVTTVTVPWYGIYAGDNRPSSLNNLCPLRAETVSTSAMADKERSEDDAEEKKKSAKEMLKEKKKRIIFGDHKKNVGNKAGRKDSRPRNSREATEIIRKAIPRSSEFDMVRLRRNHHAWAQAQAQARTTPQAPVAQEQPQAQVKVQPQPQSRAKYSLRRDADIKPQANMLRRGKALARNTKEKKDDGRSFTKLSNEDNLYPLLEDEDNQLFFYVVPERRLGIVRLLTFFPEDSKAFFDVFVQWFDRLSQVPEVDSVVIDVRGNDGGDLGLLEVILRYLFPTLRPADIETNMLKTAFLNDWKIVYEPDEDDPEDSIWYAWNTTKPVDDYYAGVETQSFSYLNGTTYTKNFTKRLLWDVQYYDYGKLSSFSPFDPQHVYIVSDGQCYSACGVFTKLAQDTHAAKVLGYSFNPFYIDREGLETYNPGSCPGLELDSEQLDDIRQKPEYAPYFNDFRNFPPTLPRDDELIGWTQSVSYSIDPRTRNQTLYFKNNTVDDVIPFFSNIYDGDKDNLLNIAWYIDEAYVQPQYCFDWEVNVDGSCAAPAGSHQVWGHPCKGESFDTSTCAFASCEKGYFLSAVEECSPLPYWQDGDQGGKRMSK